MNNFFFHRVPPVCVEKWGDFICKLYRMVFGISWVRSLGSQKCHFRGLNDAKVFQLFVIWTFWVLASQKSFIKKKMSRFLVNFASWNKKRVRFFGPSKQKPCIFSEKNPNFPATRLHVFFCVLAVGFSYFENTPEFLWFSF